MDDPDLKGLVVHNFVGMTADKVGDDFSSISAVLRSSNTRDKGALKAMLCRINYW